MNIQISFQTDRTAESAALCKLTRRGSDQSYLYLNLPQNAAVGPTTNKNKRKMETTDFILAIWSIQNQSEICNLQKLLTCSLPDTRLYFHQLWCLDTLTDSKTGSQADQPRRAAYWRHTFVTGTTSTNDILYFTKPLQTVTVL